MESSQPSAPNTLPPNHPMQAVMELLQGASPEAICAKYGIARTELDQRLANYQAANRRGALQDGLTFQKVGRNDPCTCGSGKKYKKCCLANHEEARRSVSPEQRKELEERAKQEEKLQKEIEKGFDLLFTQDFAKARSLAERLLEATPEDDRLHDIVFMAALATGDYDNAFSVSRGRWQVAQEEKAFFREYGFHKREGLDKEKPAHFYSPSTWLDKFWISQLACDYSRLFPQRDDSDVAKTVAKLKGANDMNRFPSRQDEGLQARKQAFAPILADLEREGTSAIPYLLPLTYTISWASLFVPDLLCSYGTDNCIRLLAELSMFRFPFFAQNCLVNLESFGDRAVTQIRKVLEEEPTFDELKVGMIMVLGNIVSQDSYEILVKLTNHENPYVVHWATQALEQHNNPEALPHLEKAKERMSAHSKIAGAIQGLNETMNG